MNDAKQIGKRWGLWFGVGLIVYGIVFRQAGLTFESPLAIVFYTALPIVAWLSVRELYRKDTSSGFKAQLVAASYSTVIAAAIYTVSVYVYNAFIDDSILVAVEQYVRQTAIDSGLTGAKLESAFNQAALLSQPVPFVIAVFLQLVIAGLSSALMLAMWYHYRQRSQQSP